MDFNFTDKRNYLLIDEQVPQFLHDFGPKFIKFIEKYYEWLSTSKMEIVVEYLNDSVPDLNINLDNIVDESGKPSIKGLHTNSVSKLMSIQKVDRNNYVFQVKHYSESNEKFFPLDDENSFMKKIDRQEISKGYSVDEYIEFTNDPYKLYIGEGENEQFRLKVKSFTQQSEMSSKNTWNSSDIDLTLNFLVDNYMKDYLKSYPLVYPNPSESSDINDKVSRNYKVISMGHRNPQGLYYNKEDNFLIEAEHGPQGGDEINIIKLNQKEIPNYGWAISSYGEHYGGANASYNQKTYEKYPLYKSHSDYGFIEPIKYFVPSIGISQIVGLDKKNHYVVASLKDSSLYFFELKDNKEIINMKRIEIGERIRDMIKYNNELYLFLEDTASFAQVILK